MRLLLISTIFVGFIKDSEACWGLGGCGWGGCGMSIMPSFGCGRFCRMAKGAKTLSADERVEDAVVEDPDTMFQKCCAESSLPHECMQKCTFTGYTKEALTAMFFRQDACPIQAAVDIHRCAAMMTDHKECCLRNGIHTTLAGDKCNVFCDQTPGNVTQLDMSYVPCMERFDQMKSCFWHDANENYLKYLQRQKLGENIEQQQVQASQFGATAGGDLQEEFTAEPPSPAGNIASDHSDATILSPDESGVFPENKKNLDETHDEASSPEESDITSQIGRLNAEEEKLRVQMRENEEIRNSENARMKEDIMYGDISQQVIYQEDPNIQMQMSMQRKPWYMYD